MSMNYIKVVIVLCIFSFIFFKYNITFAENIQSYKNLYYKGILPGKTSVEDAFKVLGKTDKTRKNDDGSISYIYESKKPHFPHEITIKNNQIVHMAITVEDTSELNIKTVHKILGEPKRKGYSYYSFTLRVSIYPERGMIFIYEEKDGTVIEKQYFIPCSLEEFEKTFGKNFPKEYPYKM